MKKDLITLLVLAYLVLTFLVPVLRHRILFERWPLVFHLESDPLQRLMGGLLGILVSAWAVWACLNWMLPPDRLGVWRPPAWLDWVGLCFVLGGASLQFAGQSTMGASFRVGIDTHLTPLVTAGVFGKVRNPIFDGLLTVLLGFALLTPCPWTLMSYLWILSLVLIQVRQEEAHLIKTRGEKYLHYAERVGRFFPGLGKLSANRSSIRGPIASCRCAFSDQGK